MKILIVDDEPDIRLVLRASLQRAGRFEVIEAGSGEQALVAAVAAAPDAVVLDVTMPGLDGPATLARLRGDARTAAIPVVFLTGNVAPREVDRLCALGAAGVIGKPFEPLGVADELRALLRRG